MERRQNNNMYNQGMGYSNMQNPNAPKIEVSNKYCYDMVSSLIDYRGDIAKNIKSGEKNYSDDFSPNNIKRLIISGDGIKLDYHVEISGLKHKVKLFQDMAKQKVKACVELPDYKPMLWAIADRVCSSIEEVIILTESESGVDLSKELNLEGLMSGRTSIGGNSLKDIGQRYKRLAAFTIVKTDLQSYLADSELSNINRTKKLASDTEFIKSRGNITKLKEDYWKYYGSTSAYVFDGQDSRLNTYFRETIKEKEQEEKEEGINKLRRERLGTQLEETEKLLEKYKGLSVCVIKYSKLLQESAQHPFVSELYIQKSYTGMLRDPKEYKEILRNSKTSSEELESVKKELINATQSMYSYITGLYTTSLLLEGKTKDLIRSEYKRVVRGTRVYLNDEEIAKLNQAGYAIERTKVIKTSIGTMLSFLVEYTLISKDKKTEKLGKMQKESYWVDLYERSVLRNV